MSREACVFFCLMENVDIFVTQQSGSTRFVSLAGRVDGNAQRVFAWEPFVRSAMFGILLTHSG